MDEDDDVVVDIEDLANADEWIVLESKGENSSHPAKAKSSTANDLLDASTSIRFRTSILEWYDANRRDLPWRGADPYGVWVSEIMCQQTKVDTVIPYYNRWMAEFPTVEALAKATIDDVNRVWAGLGYYRRAKFLHEGAVRAWETYKGQLPGTKKELMTIKGIGDYTSSAISSISFNQRDAAVDGNVIRVFSRLRAVPLEAKDKLLQKRAVTFAQDLIKHCDRPGDFNQSMMELGAMVCTPKKPKCSECPVRFACKAVGETNATPESISETYPARPSADKAPLPEKHVYVAVVTRHGDDAVLATRRPNDGGLLANQWELVCVERDHAQAISVTDIKEKLTALGTCKDCLGSAHPPKSETTFKHVFSHLKHHVTPFRYHLSSSSSSSCTRSVCVTQRASDDALKWIPVKDLKRAGLTRSMTKALEICGLILK